MDLETRLAQLEALLTQRETLNAVLTEQNAALTEQNAALTKQLEALQEKLGQTSENSNKPPSSDGPGRGRRRKRKNKRKGSQRRGRSERKQGGQPGHPGAHRELVPAEQVTEVEDLYPQHCEDCSARLPKTPDPNAKRYQSLEVPILTPETTEYRRHAVTCPRCSRKNRMPYEECGIPSSPFGPRLMSIVATLTGIYHVSRRDTAKLMSELLGVKLSTGSVSNIEGRVAEALAPVADEVDRHIESAQVRHADGTSWLMAGVMISLWTLATTSATAYKIVKTGSKAVLRPLFGAMKGILVSDRAKALNFWAMESRQICWAHLLRKFVSFSERDGPARTIGTELLDCTAVLFEYWQAYRDARLDRASLQARLAPLQRHVEALLVKAALADIRGVSGSCADILSHKAALWNFVEHDDVEPTNNHAERELRRFVLWRKSSFGTQSERGNRFAERIKTAAHTARKQHKGLLPFLTASCRAYHDGEVPPSLFVADAA